MRRVETRAELAAVLARPVPWGELDGALWRAPEVVLYLAPCTLGEVCRWATSPAALAWREGRVSWSAGAAARLRLQAVVRRDEAGTPLATGADDPFWASLPAGTVDRLLYASDRATGYRRPAGLEAAPGGLDELTARYGTARARWLTELWPQDSDAAVCVHPYDFATLAACEAAATLTVPGGGELRLEVLSYPTLLAAVVRAGDEPDAAPLLDEALARQLPYGAARRIVETADVLSEMGGPAPGVRFLDHVARPGVDGPGALAAAVDGSVPQ